MKKIFKHCITNIILLNLLILSVGCERKLTERNNDDQSAKNVEEVYYGIHETVLPNPDMSLIMQFGVLKDDEFIRELSYSIQGDTIYRVVQILGESSKRNDYFIQKLESPYQEWNNYDINPNNWDNDISDTKYYSIQDVQISQDNIEYIILNQRGWVQNANGDWVENENRYFIGVLSNGNSYQILYEISDNVKQTESENKKLSLFTESDIYGYKLHDMMVDKYTKKLEDEKTYFLYGNVWGIFQNSESQQVYWYGITDNQFGIWTVEDNLPRLESFSDIGKYDEQYVHTACSKQDTIYLTDEKTLWRIGTKKNIEAICNFIEQGYLLEDIYALSVQDETVYLLTQLDGEYFLLLISEEERSYDKQEIVLMGIIGVDLQDTITKFNRKSEKYHITIKGKKDDESVSEYNERVQRETLAGDVPDLYSMSPRIAENYAKNGFLQSMENILSEPKTYWEEAFDTAKIDGIQYGIPYSAYLSTCVFSGDIAGNRKTWNMDEMMDAVRNSQTELLLDGQDAYSCIANYILYDKTNTSYIDWKKMESHLDETPFLKVLKFAKEFLRTEKQYQDDTEFNEFGQAMQKGIIASLFNKVPILPSSMNFFYTAFNGNPSFIGIPRECGGGIDIMTNCLFMSTKSKNEMGIREFLNFLLSDTVQLQNAIKYDYLPMKLELMDEIYEYNKSNLGKYTVFGISYTKGGLKDQQIEQYKELIMRSRPYMYSDIELSNIICEELVPYLDGYRTLEETASIIDNRVQLYLNEQE